MPRERPETMPDLPENSPTIEEEAGTVLYPLLPLRDIVIFPYMVTPLFVGRPRSIHALEGAMEKDKLVFLATQKDPKIDEPGPGDIYEVGTLGQVIQLLKLPDGTVKVLIEGKSRARINAIVQREECVFVEIDEMTDVSVSTPESEALIRSIVEAFENYVNLGKKVPPEMVSSVSGITEPGRLADTVIAHLNVRIPEKQEILALIDPHERLEQLLALMGREVEILQIEKKIRNRVKSQMERSQKGILPQRADAGDPEGARRERRIQAGNPRTGGEDRPEADVQGGDGQGLG
jgi:ATP-dependent Lon protease